MTCACAIKQTFNCSFWSVHYIYLIFFKNYFKAVLPVPVKRRVNGWNKDALDRCISKDLTSNSSQLHFLNEHGDLSFYCTFLITVLWETIDRESLTLSLPRSES